MYKAYHHCMLLDMQKMMMHPEASTGMVGCYSHDMCCDDMCSNDMCSDDMFSDDTWLQHSTASCHVAKRGRPAWT